MSLKIKIAGRLKAKAAGVNLSKERIDAIVARAEKGGLTDESDDTAIDAQLDLINELTPFKEIAAYDDHQRAKAKKDADDKEAERLKAIADGKAVEVELPADAPEWMKTFMTAQAAQTKALTDQIAAFGKKEVANTQRERYIESMKGTPKEYQAKELKRFDRMKFDKPEDFEAFLEDTKDDHADAVQEATNNDLGNDRPTGSTGGKQTAAKEKVASADVVDDIMSNI